MPREVKALKKKQKYYVDQPEILTQQSSRHKNSPNVIMATKTIASKFQVIGIRVIKSKMGWIMKQHKMEEH